MHPNNESLSAYLDGEVEANERNEIESHLVTCGDCRFRIDALTTAKQAVAGLPRVEMTGDEIREVRHSVTAKGTARRSRPWSRIAAAVGALGVVAVAFVGFVVLRDRQGASALCSEPITAGEGAPAEFSSDAEVASSVSSDTEITSKLGDCRVSDVGVSQSKALEAFAPSEPAREEKAKSVEENAASDAAATGTPRSLDFCLRERLRLIPKPTMPISGRAVTYRDQQAWLLVYAYADTAEETDQLDLLQIWVVKQVDCEKDESVLVVQSQHAPRS